MTFKNKEEASSSSPCCGYDCHSRCDKLHEIVAGIVACAMWNENNKKCHLKLTLISVFPWISIFPSQIVNVILLKEIPEDRIDLYWMASVKNCLEKLWMRKCAIQNISEFITCWFDVFFFEYSLLGNNRVYIV